MTNEPFESVETTRLRLRCARTEDAASVSALVTPEVSRWVASWPVPFTLEMAVERISAVRMAAAEGKQWPCVIERRSDGALLGWIGVIRGATNDRHAMLGYWLGAQYHGLGYMREAAVAGIRAAFEALDLEVIEAATQPDNAPSIAVLQACRMMPFGERTIFASARARQETCLVYKIIRPAA